MVTYKKNSPKGKHRTKVQSNIKNAEMKKKINKIKVDCKINKSYSKKYPVLNHLLKIFEYNS